MLNYVWLGMLAAGFLIGIINGRVDEVTSAALNSAGKAVELSISLLGIVCLWTGLMAVAEKSGIVGYIAKILMPILKFLFPKVPKNHNAMGAIVMNLSANFLGLGNAATPLGLKAMSELQKLNKAKDTATDAMCMFLVLNTSAVQLVPATVMAVRADAHSSNPAEIIVTVWIASICATISGVIAARLLAGVEGIGRHIGGRRKRRTIHL